MDRLAFTALNAINEQRISRQVRTNELANVATTGFKRSYEAAYKAIKTEGSGYDTRISPLLESKDFIDLNPGAVVVTANTTDIVIRGQGVLGVQAPNGDVAFTRRGDLRLNAQGALENGAGHLVLDNNGGPITIPAGFRINITDRGQIFATNPAAPAPQVEVPVGQLMLRDSSNVKLVRRNDTLFDPFIDNTRTPGDFASGPQPVFVQSGALEGSNVNPINAMVALIDAERSFESNIRFVKEARSIDESGAQLLKA